AEGETEYGTGADAVRSRYYGESEELLPWYSWYSKNAKDRTWPVGTKKPNDLGLFDLHGNIYAWCQESYKEYPRTRPDEVSEDREDELSVDPTKNRVVRCGSFLYPASYIRSPYRYALSPRTLYLSVGFRVARTIR